MALDPSAFASATPAGAAAAVLSAAAQTATSSNAANGPSALGPKSINVSGFGGRSSGSATQSLTSPEPDQGHAFPFSSIGDAGVPSWLLPVVIGVVVVAVGLAFLRRK